MRYLNGAVVARSRHEFYALEEIGTKPNTIRFVPADELMRLAKCARIRIERPAANGLGYDASFERAITLMLDVTDVLPGAVTTDRPGRLMLICWDPQEVKRG